MNVYDFDDTIYDGDSTVDFYLFCLLRRPQVLLSAPIQLSGFVLKALGWMDTTAMKERFFAFVRRLSDTEALVEAFWDTHLGKIKPWYLAQKAQDDVIISASPAFLLSPACKRLGIPEPIATRVDARTGCIEGQNCKGEAKTVRFREIYPHQPIDCFYSDSLTDAPMAARAARAFVVEGSSLRPWKGERHEQTKVQL